LNRFPKERNRYDALHYGYRDSSATNVFLEGSSASTKGTPNGILKIDIPWCFGESDWTYLPICAIKNRHIRIDIQLHDIDKLV